MRLYFFILFWAMSFSTAFGQVRNLPVLYYLKKNLLKAPVEVPQGKRLVWERAYYKNGKLDAKYPLYGEYTSNPNEFIIHYGLGEIAVVASLDGKEVWKETFMVKRSTNIFYKNIANEIFAEVNLPISKGVTFETDNGTVIHSTLPFHAQVYPSEAGVCTVTAKYQGNTIWQNTFEVRDFPDAPYRLYLGNSQGKAIDMSKPLPANLISKVIVETDSTLKQSIRIYYGVSTAHYVLSRGGTPITTGRSADGSIPSPHSLGARSGDKMFIWVESIRSFVGGGCPRNVKLPPISSFTFIVK